MCSSLKVGLLLLLPFTRLREFSSVPRGLRASMMTLLIWQITGTLSEWEVELEGQGKMAFSEIIGLIILLASWLVEGGQLEAISQSLLPP